MIEDPSYQKPQELYKHPTFAEVLLWAYMNNEELGYTFQRHVMVSDFSLDFYCPELKLAIEINSNAVLKEIHKKNDQTRNQKLEELGIKVICVDGWEVKTNFPELLVYLKQQISKREKRLKNSE